MDKLKVQELRTELQLRGLEVTGKRKQDLEMQFDELRRGITNVPALLQGVPDKTLAEFGLNHYEISPIEPLHDIKGHLSNMIDEIKVLVTGPAKVKVDLVFSSVLSKETLRGSDYRKAAVLILLALQEFQPQSTITAVLDTAVEITEILYAAPEKRTPKSVLRLHNLTFIHAKLCEDVFGCPKTMSRRKMFGRYYHALTAHSPLVNRIISPCLLNAEVEERTFGQCKAITRATSNQHTNHIISNILVRLHYEKKRNVNASSTIQAQEGYVSKLVKTLPSRTNTLIPFNWIENSPLHYQAHLERIGDFLQQGQGGWWRFTDSGVEYFDMETPQTPPPTPTLQHFRTTSMSDVEFYLITQWERCLENGVQLPAKHIRTYSVDGNVLDVRQCSGYEHVQPSSLTPCRPTDTATEEQVQHSTPPFTPCRPTDTATEEQVQHSTPPLTPCRPTDTATEEQVQHSTPPLTPCRPVKQKVSNAGLSNGQLSSVCKCILSVVSARMRTEVLAFDQLRTKIKASQSLHREVPHLYKRYQVASTTLRDHLIQEYQEALACKSKPTPLGQTLQHKINVLKRVLNHEWGVKLQH